ncbi:MAG: type II toxin-antitoxin system VapC family toxin [Phycisphaeraceae bacterium]|nr:type II toxin-antitoxin system VapC family toxin [Phycisphaeraceae bacterium]
MSHNLLVDTDVLVDYLRGQAKAVAFVKKHVDRIALSSIVVAELYAGVRDDEERAILDNLMAIFRIIPVTVAIAQTAGLLKRDFSKTSGLGTADAVIAATAQIEQLQLCSLNIKHYPMFKGLKPAYVK